MTRGSVSAKRADHAHRSATLLQERDLEMLRSLADARLLTVEALEWLHFASWRTRYRRCIEQQDAPNAARYQASSNLYRRLRGLCDGQYIQRVMRSVAAASTMFYRVPDAYGLTAARAELLTAHRGVDAAASIASRKRAIQNLDHAIAIGRLYAALRAELEYRGLRLTEWQGDHRLARNAYDRIAIAGVREPLPILPDATFVLDSIRYFVEIDRGTRPLRSWTDKVRAYAAYQQSALLAARYQVAQFRVLIVAPTPVRLLRIAEEVAMVTRQECADYVFLGAEYVHPTTIRRGWQRIATIDWTTQRVVDGWSSRQGLHLHRTHSGSRPYERHALQQRSVSPRTRQQQQSRLWSLVMLLLFLGLPAVLSGAVLCGLARAVKQPRAFAWLALAGVLGLALLGWQWHTLLADLTLLRDAARPVAGILRPTPNHAVTLAQITRATGCVADDLAAVDGGTAPRPDDRQLPAHVAG